MNSLPHRLALRLRLPGALRIAAIPAAILMAATPVGASGGDAKTAPSEKAETVELAPPGACAKPRGLPASARPAGFEIAGPPAERITPGQVGSETRVLTTVVPVPAPPRPPGPGLCDTPAACSPEGPAFRESEPVPSLPPGLGRP